MNNTFKDSRDYRNTYSHRYDMDTHILLWSVVIVCLNIQHEVQTDTSIDKMEDQANQDPQDVF
jgi:hypothetical protein